MFNTMIGNLNNDNKDTFNNYHKYKFFWTNEIDKCKK